MSSANIELHKRVCSCRYFILSNDLLLTSIQLLNLLLLVLGGLDGPVRTENITLIADVNSITVKWNITVVNEGVEKMGNDETFTLIRRISLRPFGTDNITRFVEYLIC